MKKPTGKKKSTDKPKSPATEKVVQKPLTPTFTPPAKPAVKAQKGPDPRDKEVVKDGSEFDVIPTEELPATPHEHGVSAPSSETGSGTASIS